MLASFPPFFVVVFTGISDEKKKGFRVVTHKSPLNPLSSVSVDQEDPLNRADAPQVDIISREQYLQRQEAEKKRLAEEQEKLAAARAGGGGNTGSSSNGSGVGSSSPPQQQQAQKK